MFAEEAGAMKTMRSAQTATNSGKPPWQL